MTHDIIIAVLGKSNWIEQCVKSIEKGNPLTNYNITVIDTENPRIGLAEAWNDGIHKTDGEFITLLNDDTIVCPDYIEHSERIIGEESNIGILVPTLSNCANYQKAPYLKLKNNFPVVNDIESAWNVGKTIKEMFYPSIITDLIDACGCCMTFKRSIYEEVGDFFEGFFYYGEENDWADRMLAIGKYKIAWVQWLYVHHFRGQTSKSLDDLRKIKQDSGLLLKQRRVERNQMTHYEICQKQMNYWLEEWINV